MSGLWAISLESYNDSYYDVLEACNRLYICIVSNIMSNEYEFYHFLEFYLLGVLVLSILGFRGFVSMTLRRKYKNGHGRSKSQLPLVSATVSVFLIALYYILATPNVRWKKLIVSGILMMALVAAVFSLSRGSWVALMASTTCMLFFYLLDYEDSMKYIYVFVGIALIALSLILITVYFPDRVFYLIQRFKSINPNTDSLSIRLFIWNIAIELFKQRPIIGTGFAGFKTAFREYIIIAARDPHNTYLLFLVELGVVGFFFWMGFLYHLFINAVRNRTFRIITIPMLFFIMIINLKGTYVLGTFMWIFLATIAGVSHFNTNKTGSTQMSSTI